MKRRIIAILIIGIISNYSSQCSPKHTTERTLEARKSLYHSVSISSDYHIRYAGKTENKISLSYDAYFDKGPLSIKLYTTIPEFLNIGNVNGVWDEDGEIVSAMFNQDVSVNRLTNRNLGINPIKDLHFSNIYSFNLTPHGYGYQELFSGLKTDIETYSNMNLSVALYAKKQWQNYGQSNENSWDGYRFKVDYSFPIKLFSNEKCRASYYSYTNFDWGSHLVDRESSYPGSVKPNQMTSNHSISVNYAHWFYSVSAQYFHNGGHSSDKEESDGWGYLMKVGYNF